MRTDMTRDVGFDKYYESGGGNVLLHDMEISLILMNSMNIGARL